MAVDFKRESFGGRKPIFWRGDVKELPGGYKLTNKLKIGAVVPLGSYLYINPGTLTAALCKVAEVVAGGTETAIRVAKGHLFVATEIVMISGKKQGVTITSVDSSNSDYDVLNVSEALTGATTGAVLLEANGAGAAQKPANIPNSVVAVDRVVKDGDVTVTAAYEARLIRTSVIVPSEYVSGLLLAGNPNILIVNQ